MYSKIINVCWLHGCLCIHAQFSVYRKSSGNVCQVTVQLTSIKHISFPVSFTSLSQESLLTWFMFLVPYIPTLSSVSSGSFGSAFSPIEIISITSFLSSWKTSCHPTSFLKIYSIFFRTQITIIASDLLNTCALRHLPSGWHPLLPTPSSSRIVSSSRLPLS